MSDHETNSDKLASAKAARASGDDRSVPPESDAVQQPDPDSQQSTTARPRGHTEDPDRTL